MAGPRLCGRPACPAPASATLSFSYATRTLWLDDLGEPQPQVIDLCRDHADRLRPPVGWEGLDRRRRVTGPARAAS